MTSFEPFKRGNRFEYLVAAVFQGQGYLVRKSVPLKVARAGQDATDIDVLGIKFTKPFQPHRVICDCRDRQKSKPFERIFWAKGLAAFANATETYVALPRASWEVVNFAKSGQVRVLTDSILTETFERIYGKGGHAYGVANESFYEPYYQKLFRVAKKETEARDILFRSRMLFLAGDPYVSLNSALADLKTTAIVLGRLQPTSDLRFQIWRYVAADLVVAISLLLLYIASDALGLSKEERERHVLDRLTYGDISPVKAKDIFALAKQLALEAAKVGMSDDSQQALLPYDIGEVEMPDYAPDVYGLVERAMLAPELYHELPQLLDFLLFEQALQDEEFSDEQYRRTFPSPFQQERLKVARNIFYFARDTCGLNLQAFWPREIDHMPKTNTTVPSRNTR